MFFVLFLVENLTVFNEKERRIALIPCIVMTLCQFWHTHTIQVWGFNRLSSQRFCQNLLSNRRKSTSHFLFIVTAHSGLVGNYEETMEFKESIRLLSERINEYKNILHSEEETKRFLILPFIEALGYDVYNPFEIISELKCDIGIKNGERVDYAILINNKPIILIECKRCEERDLTPHINQLYRYYIASPETKLGILTNGIVYRFYADLQRPNIMDAQPFYEIDMSNISDSEIEELKLFCKSYFNIDAILNFARERKYKKELETLIKNELLSPSADLVRYFIQKVYNENVNQDTFNKLSCLVKSIISDTYKTLKTPTSISVNQTQIPIYAKTVKNYSDKDYSRYSVNGEGNYGKCRTPAIVVETYLRNRGALTIDELKNTFPSDLQGSHGVVRDELEVKDKELHRFIPLIFGNKRIYVSNQWTPANFSKFMHYVNSNIEGITIKKVE